jgi:hypothetical protein
VCDREFPSTEPCCSACALTVWQEVIAATDFDAMAADMSGELPDYGDLFDSVSQPIVQDHTNCSRTGE